MMRDSGQKAMELRCGSFVEMEWPYPFFIEIGGDSVRSIQQRFLAKDSDPSPEEIQISRIRAEDQVEIIHEMAVLDPTGDWLGRGARALDNPRTATGEESLDKLYAQLEDLRRGGVQSQTFSSLKRKVSTRYEIA